MKFFILMADYGNDIHKVHGFQAVVKPEETRRDIVEQVREILNSENKTVKFVKAVDGNYIEDITDEIIAEASDDIEARMADPMIALANRIQANFDHARDLRKNEVV